MAPRKASILSQCLSILPTYTVGSDRLLHLMRDYLPTYITTCLHAYLYCRYNIVISRHAQYVCRGPHLCSERGMHAFRIPQAPVCRGIERKWIVTPERAVPRSGAYSSGALCAKMPTQIKYLPTGLIDYRCSNWVVANFVCPHMHPHQGFSNGASLGRAVNY